MKIEGDMDKEQVLPTNLNGFIAAGKNRYERRRIGIVRGLNKEHTAITNEMDLVGDVFHRAQLERDRVVKLNNSDFGSVIFRGTPFVIPLLQAAKSLSEHIDKWYAGDIVPSAEIMNQFDAKDFWTRKIGAVKKWGITWAEGTSWKDIEEMDPDLSSNNIVRINRIFRNDDPMTWKDVALKVLFKREKPLTPVDPYKSFIRENFIFLATQPLAQSEGKKVSIPDELQPVFKCATAFFEHYTNLLLDFDSPLMTDRYLITSLLRGAPWLAQGLGYYMMARLGITRPSLVKLLRTRAEASFFPYRSWHNVGLYNIEEGSKNVYTLNKLPSDLLRHQDLNTDQDDRASVLLINHYNGLNLSQEEQLKAFDDVHEPLDKLSDLYSEALYKDIVKSSKRRLGFSFEGHVINNMTVTTQNRLTLMFILELNDSEKTHLTLEIDRKNRYFGLPPKGALHDSAIVPLLLKDILNPLLEYGKMKHPEIESPNNNSRILDFSNYVSLKDQGFHESRAPEDGPVVRIARRIKEAIMGDPIPPQPKEIKREVIYSREQIVDALRRQDENTPPEVIDHLMKSVEAFALGNSKPKIMRVVDGIWWDRDGDYRLLYRNLGNGKFRLVEVGRKSSGITDSKHVISKYG